MMDHLEIGFGLSVSTITFSRLWLKQGIVCMYFTVWKRAKQIKQVLIVIFVLFERECVCGFGLARYWRTVSCTELVKLANSKHWTSLQLSREEVLRGMVSIDYSKQGQMSAWRPWSPNRKGSAESEFTPSLKILKRSVFGHATIILGCFKDSLLLTRERLHQARRMCVCVCVCVCVRVYVRPCYHDFGLF